MQFLALWREDKLYSETPGGAVNESKNNIRMH